VVGNFWTANKFHSPDKCRSVNITKLYWENPDETDGIKEQIAAIDFGYVSVTRILFWID